MTFPAITGEIEARFWARVDKSPGQGPKGECWCWTGPLEYPNSYPAGFSITANGKSKLFRASHVALAIAGTPRPAADVFALHCCDWKPCVRPDHLRWGTRLENTLDYIERRPHKSALQDHQVREIRASNERGCDLARRFGVTDSCIHQVRSGRTHKHIT